MVSIQKKDNNYGIFRETSSCARVNFLFTLAYFIALTVIGAIVFLAIIVI